MIELLRMMLKFEGEVKMVKLSHIILGTTLGLFTSLGFAQQSNYLANNSLESPSMEQIKQELGVKNPFKVKFLEGGYVTTSEAQHELILCSGLESGKMNVDPESGEIYGTVRNKNKYLPLVMQKADVNGDKIITYDEALQLKNSYIEKNKNLYAKK
jgi:hypothetical protein